MERVLVLLENSSLCLLDVSHLKPKSCQPTGQRTHGLLLCLIIYVLIEMDAYHLIKPYNDRSWKALDFMASL
jgi:hypothetical protein